MLAPGGGTAAASVFIFCSLGQRIPSHVCSGLCVVFSSQEDAPYNLLSTKKKTTVLRPTESSSDQGAHPHAVSTAAPQAHKSAVLQVIPHSLPCRQSNGALDKAGHGFYICGLETF
jgi:hypothetical protein